MVRPDDCLRDIVGIIPAGGEAKRIAPLPCSKEIYPVGFSHLPGTTERRPKVACQYLAEKMRLAGITKTYIILRAGKWDIPSYLGAGRILNMDLAYLMSDLPYGVPYTLNQAYPFVKDSLVAFGFPDILFEPDDVFVELLRRHEQSNSDLLLGLFPADTPSKVDIVDVNERGRVREIIAKPAYTRLGYSWAVALWTPIFTQFLKNYVESHKPVAPNQPEPSVGEVIQLAVEENLDVQALVVSDEPYLDIGTPEGLIAAMKKFSVP